MIENPQPAWLPLLLFAFPGILLAACSVNEHLFPRNDRPLCTIPAIGLVLALLPTHLLALAFGSLAAGLTVAWVIIGACGYAWFARHWRNFLSALSNEHAGWAGRLGIAALATLPIVLPTILLNFHDEANFNGHHAIIAHLQNGSYPPRYLYEPSLPLLYHYAFDLAGAIVTGLLRVRVDHAIDLLTLSLWPCMFLLLWRVGDHVGARGVGLFVALAVCFSGGWPAIAWGSQCGFCAINGLRVNPPFIDNFFQHPWSIGVPIFCLVVLQRAALPRIGNQIARLVALTGSLVLLSVSQAVLFITTLAALGLTEAWRVVRFRDRGAGWVIGCLVASLLGAQLSGGFFASGPFPRAGGILDTGFYIRNFTGINDVLAQVQWNVASFGALLVLGFLGLRRATRDKIFLTILAGLGLIIVNLLRYKYTWDIVKFGTVSFIALAIGAGIALADLVIWARTFTRRAFFVGFLVAVSGQGLPYPFIMLWAYDSGPRPPFSNQMIRPYFSRAYPVDANDAIAVSFLRTHMGASEIVYRAEEKSEPYAIWGGLPTQASVYAENGKADDAYGLGEEKLAARSDLARVSETWLDRLSAAHVVWIVTDPDDTAIEDVLASPEGRRRALLAAQYGNVRVFRLN